MHTTPGSLSLAEARAALARDYGIKSAFARPDQLSALIGISGNSIRAQAQAGCFPIPCRRVGRAILFDVDDVVAWWKGGVDAPKPTSRVDPGAKRTSQPLPASLAAQVAQEAGSRESATRAEVQEPASAEIVASLNSKAEAARVKREALAAAAQVRARIDAARAARPR